MADQDLEQISGGCSRPSVSRRGFLGASGLSASAPSSRPAPGARRRRHRRRPAPPSRPERRRAPRPPSRRNSSCTTGPTTSTRTTSLAFKEHFDVEKFTYDTYASNEELFTKLQGGANGQYDISAPTAEYVPTMVEQGFIQKIDWSKIPNAQVHRADVQGPLVGPAATSTSCPKDWGTTGITVRTNVVTEEVKTWKQFFEVAPKYSGRIVVVDSPGDVFTAPLKALGYSLNSIDPAELERGPRAAAGPRPARPRAQLGHVRGADQDRGGGPRAHLDRRHRRDCATSPRPRTSPTTSRRTGRCSGWTPGSSWPIAPHPEAAHAFLNFIHEPEIQAKETMTNGYATCEQRGEEVHRPGDPRRPGRLRPGRGPRRASRAHRTCRPIRCGSRSGRSSSRASAGPTG